MFGAFTTFGRMGAGANVPWSPTKLFAAGEKGGLWDFTNLSNLYQDSAGTTPVTAVGDPIGKVLDTSGRSNHLTQATSTKRPLLGRMPATGVRNLLTYTEDFSNAIWAPGSSGGGVGGVKTPNYGTDPDGGSTACRVQLDVSAGSAGAQSQIYYNSLLPLETRTNSIWIKSLTTPTTIKAFDAGSGTISVTNSWQRLAVSKGFQSIQVLLVKGETSNTADLLIWHPQLETGSTATAYQKVTTANDITEPGVASVYTAYFDGVDDCLVSLSIDFTGTDKMTVFAGARYVNDFTAVVAELSDSLNTNAGSFYIVSGFNGSVGITSASRGTSGADAGVMASYVTSSPLSCVITSSHSIPGDLTALYVNRVHGTDATGDKGSGNFGNYPLYVGQRYASSLPYKGFMTALSARGATTDAATIVKMEQWLAARTPGVNLP